MNRHTPLGPIVISALVAVGCGSSNSAAGTDGRGAATVTTAPATVVQTTASSTGTSAAAASADVGLPFVDPFDDDRNRWGIVDHPEYGSTSYEGGDYVWVFRGSIAHWLPEAVVDRYDRGELDMLNVAVRADVTVSEGGGVVGVFCRESPDTNAAYQWYEFVARDGYAAIRHADDEGNIDVLADTKDLIAPLGVSVSLDASCINDATGTAQLALSVNGKQLLKASDDDPLGNGVVGLQAYTFPAHQQMTIRWHEFNVIQAQS
jgi:hypothetical protein